MDKRKREERAVAEADGARTGKVLDAIEANVAVLDSKGFIVLTNKGWRDFAATNPLPGGAPPRNADVGVNYLDICRASQGPSADGAQLVYAGVLSVLEGRARVFEHEYPCHSPDQQRWFLMKVKPLARTRPREVVVIHTNITERRLAEMASLARQEELGAALAQLQVMAGQIKSSIGAAALPQQTSLMVSGHLPGARSPLPSEADLLRSLSRRELEVLSGLVAGERNLDIAARLQLSKKSISTYRSRVLEKLKVDSNAQLVAFATRAGLMNSDMP